MREELGEMLVDRADPAGPRGRGALELGSAIDEIDPSRSAATARCRPDKPSPAPGASWSSAAPRSGTMSGIPLARASAATRQKVSDFAAVDEGVGAGDQPCELPRGRRSSAGARRCASGRPTAPALPPRPVAGEKKADRPPARAFPTARTTISHLFSPDKRPMPRSRTASESRPSEAKRCRAQLRRAHEPARSRPGSTPIADRLALGRRRRRASRSASLPLAQTTVSNIWPSPRRWRQKRPNQRSMVAIVAIPPSQR